MTNKLVVIINSLKVPNIKEVLLYEISYTKLQLPPEPLTRGLPPPDPRLSVLCPHLNLLNPHPPNKVPGYATGDNSPRGEMGKVKNAYKVFAENYN